ncbi:YwdI family protein [Bacillus salipaludis]|uniref:YwdI family protein n=1 Tax=Bacillus salipaludis TaxID=2547811 RepID=A0AA90TQS6_9BACI|nr:YwdI family protein [Bacillus salipaludis]MDQ6595230.1 YwdI family protein [Bacillus salipaludis]
MLGFLNISVQKLLEKMEDELQSAKRSAKGESLRERVYSIKILCELILEEKADMPVQAAVSNPPVVQQPMVVQPAFQQPMFQQPAAINQPKKLDMGDDANGDSLFDF